MFRFLYHPAVFLVVPILALSGGCRLSKPLKPLTPSLFKSGELSRAGNSAMEKGNWEEAEKKLEEAVKLNKKDAELRRHYAEALWNRGKYPEALEQLAEAVKRGGAEDASLHISLAEKYLMMNNPSTAYRHAEEAIRLSPRECKAWALHGKASWFLAERQQDSDSPDQVRQYLLQARNDYYRALSFSTNHRDLLPELAAVQMLCGQPELALATWQNLQKLFPPDEIPPDLLRGKAEAYVALHRFNDAATCLQAAQEREPDRPEIAQRLQEVVALAQHGPLVRR